MEQGQMAELRNKGYTLQEIASAAEISIGKAFLMTGGRKGKERKPYKKRLSPNVERDNDICRMVSDGLTQKQVGKIKGLSKGRISQIVKAGDNGETN